MNKTFTFGIITGMTSLVVAVPLVMGSVGAQEDATTTDRTFRFNREISQEQVQTLIDRDDAFLANADAALAVQKNATQTHRDALKAAASIEDDTERHEAVRAAHDALRKTMQNAIESNPDLAAGMHRGMGMGHGRKGGMLGVGLGHGNSPMHAEMLERLGMTEAEFDAAIENGKTPWEIAEEKGVEMPMHVGRGGRSGMMRGGMFGRE